MTHEYGGQVYLDGANMNAQVSHPFCNRLFLKLILSFFFLKKKEKYLQSHLETENFISWQLLVISINFFFW